MKRLARIAIVALPLITLAAATLYADVKTRDRTTVKFEGTLGRIFNLFGGGKPSEGTTAVKGNRKATLGGTTGQIIDLSEEKVYDLDMKKKTYTVTTFEELRRRMREAAEKAKTEVEKEQPGTKEKQEPQKPAKEYEIDFDVKDTGQKKQLAGYDTHQTIATVLSKDQLTQAQADSSNQKGGGGIGGLLAKKIIKKEEPKARSAIVTTHTEVLEVSTSASAADVAVPADFKDKK